MRVARDGSHAFRRDTKGKKGEKKKKKRKKRQWLVEKGGGEAFGSKRFPFDATRRDRKKDA